jgi:hypothetical protein
MALTQVFKMSGCGYKSKGLLWPPTQTNLITDEWMARDCNVLGYGHQTLS